MSEVIDVYDFDKTIYDGDSSLDFYIFILKRRPWLLIYLPYQLLHAALFILKLEERTKFKSNFFVYLRGVKGINLLVDRFWETHYWKIKHWYLEQDHSHDVIVSASPAFLLEPAFTKLKAKALIATSMNSATGQITGNNNRGIEKVVRLKELIKEPVIRKVYTDHKSDSPLMELAQEKYLVKGMKIIRLN
jgi:hypothetical protein